MNKGKLSGRYGAALDPCTALQSVFELADGEEREIVFRLGAGADGYSAQQTAKKTKGTAKAKDALAQVTAFWEETLGVVDFKSPDPAINLLGNGWLNYQTLASRIWGRSGFYQSGGAFGFRDQLQDVLSLLHNKPELVRQQILLSASRQFKEGDVQHWWHPPFGRGVRTTCSDDYLWLPYVTARYVIHTGDSAILDETVKFIEGRPLNPGEESYYELPVVSELATPLYDHCLRALRHGLRFGDRGLPLIGSGDWNDGMDKVGEHGKGESVWLAFFLFDVLSRFTEVARVRKDQKVLDEITRAARDLKQHIEDNAWDGDWYRRAYFDDGTPLGSKENDECRIDSIPQSWSVISGGGDRARSLRAMESAVSQLVHEDYSVIQLFDPPFNHSSLNPGYIKGYLPGVRENGGQYTHAAVWLIMASALLGERKRTYDLINLVNPVHHGASAERIAIYKTEPYVIAADVYAVEGRKGMGGWTWYTGSAGWMYQLLLESFFGIRRKGNTLYFEPCLPEEWPSAELTYRYSETVYHLRFEQYKSAGETEVLLNGEVQPTKAILLVNDHDEHQVLVKLFEK